MRKKLELMQEALLAAQESSPTPHASQAIMAWQQCIQPSRSMLALYVVPPGSRVNGRYG